MAFLECSELEMMSDGLEAENSAALMALDDLVGLIERDSEVVLRRVDIPVIDTTCNLDSLPTPLVVICDGSAALHLSENSENVPYPCSSSQEMNYGDITLSESDQFNIPNEKSKGENELSSREVPDPDYEPSVSDSDGDSTTTDEHSDSTRIGENNKDAVAPAEQIIEESNGEETSPVEQIEDAEVTNPAKRKRGRKITELSREIAKTRRMQGESYIGYRRVNPNSANKIAHDVSRDSRKLGARCSSKQCEKWKSRRCNEISEEDREAIYNQFWREMNWQEKKLYVCSTVKIEDPKQRTTKKTTPRRKVSYLYHIKTTRTTLPVCKTMYLNSLGLKFSTVRTWLETFAVTNRASKSRHPNSIGNGNSSDEDHDQGIIENNEPVGNENVRNRHLTGRSRRALKHKKAYLNQFLQQLPKLPSHYCRHSTTKVYLQTDIRSLAHLYRIYTEDCTEHNEEPLSESYFGATLNLMNIGIFHPRKDRCDICESFKTKNIPEKEYLYHLERKEDARYEKEKDKKAGQDGICHTICCDLMAVQPLPKLDSTAAYYKLKLAMHNYTIYNLGNSEVVMYWFDETETNLCASTFASCLLNYLGRLIDSSPKTTIIFTDGCTAQNRNCILSNALLHLSMTKNVRIVQKFLEKGHTQMEADSVHSTVEGQLDERDVHLPSDYVRFAKTSRMRPFPYEAKLMHHDDFRNYGLPENMFYSSIRPGKKPHDPTCCDLRWLQYDPDGIIRYKLDFKDNLTPLPSRPNKKVQPTLNFPALHKGRLKIPLDKFNDLQYLKEKFILEDCKAYYDLIPHDTDSRRKEKTKTGKKSED